MCNSQLYANDADDIVYLHMSMHVHVYIYVFKSVYSSISSFSCTEYSSFVLKCTQSSCVYMYTQQYVHWCVWGFLGVCYRSWEQGYRFHKDEHPEQSKPCLAVCDCSWKVQDNRDWDLWYGVAFSVCTTIKINSVLKILQKDELHSNYMYMQPENERYSTCIMGI